MSVWKTFLLCCLLAAAWSASGSGLSRAPAEEFNLHGGTASNASVSSLPSGNDRQGKLPRANVLRRLGTLRFRTGDGILSLAYSPSGKILASGGRNDPVRLWDVESGELLRRCDEHWVWALAFSADGKYLATAGANKSVCVWEVDTGKQIVQMTGHTATVKSLAFSSDGAMLVSGSDDGTVRVWKMADGKGDAVYRGHNFGVSAVAISPDDKQWASTSADRTIRGWESDGKSTLLQMASAASALAYLPDRKTLIVGDDEGFIRIWDIAAAKELRQWKAHDRAITHLSLGQDGNTLATAGRDQTVRLWDVAKGSEIRKIVRHAGDGDALAMTRDSKQVAVGGLNNTIRRWDAATGKPMDSPTAPEGAVTALACSPDGILAAAGFTTNEAVLFDLAAGKEKARLACGSEDAQVLLAFSADGKILATASAPGAVILWDVASAKETKRFILPENDEVCCLACSPDGLQLAFGCTQAGVLLEDAQTGKIVRQFPKLQGARAVAYSPDGKQLAVGSENMLLVCETGGFKVVRRFDFLGAGVVCLAFAPDNRTLAAGMFNGSIHLFDSVVVQGKPNAEPRVLEGHRGVVHAVAWSINGRCLVSGGFDGTVSTWEFVNGQPIASWQGHAGEVTGVAFHPSGRTVISGSRDTTLLVWDATAFGVNSKPAVSQTMGVQALDQLWKELAAADNAKGNEALWTLVSAKDGASYLSKKVFLADPQKIEQYIKDLNADTFKLREKAFAALASYERWIEGPLQDALKQRTSEEVRQRITLLLQRLVGQEATTLEQERLRVRRVIEILEQTNSPPAHELLRGLAAGAGEADLRDMAQAAWDRARQR
jgi:WD40 repeat protein